ncbi:MAG: hypothetical protein PHZ13_13055, partial [bacterium]|nr:hypothetical protein [bacterium]
IIPHFLAGINFDIFEPQLFRFPQRFHHRKQMKGVGLHGEFPAGMLQFDLFICLTTTAEKGK